MQLKSNEILMKRNEVRNRLRMWSAMIIIVQLCQSVDRRRKVIKARYDKLELEDTMARRL